MQHFPIDVFQTGLSLGRAGVDWPPGRVTVGTVIIEFITPVMGAAHFTIVVAPHSSG